MNKINGFYFFIVFIIIGILGFSLSFFLNKISFFEKHENFTFIVICFICSIIYGLIMFLLIRKK